MHTLRLHESTIQIEFKSILSIPASNFLHNGRLYVRTVLATQVFMYVDMYLRLASVSHIVGQKMVLKKGRGEEKEGKGERRKEVGVQAEEVGEEDEGVEREGEDGWERAESRREMKAEVYMNRACIFRTKE